MIERLCDLAREHDVTLLHSDAEALIDDTARRIAAAYSTYVYWLIQRTKGLTDGASILVLWREFAWTSKGSPRKDFQLRYNDVVDSERMLVAQMRHFATETEAEQSGEPERD